MPRPRRCIPRPHSAVLPLVLLVLLVTGLAPGSRAGGLPDEPQLDAVVDGPRCRVHYTLTGPDAVPDADFALEVARAVDAVAKRTARLFTAPFAEPESEGDERLHVYLLDTTDAPELDGPAYGQLQMVDDVPGQPHARTVYLVLDAGLRAGAEAEGRPWRRVLRAAVAHLYFHAIQAAYDGGLDAWAREGQAVWAELRFAHVQDGLAAHLALDDSIVHAPELPLTTAGPHAYGTAPLFAELRRRLGPGGNRALLETSATAGSALSALDTLLQAEAGLDFEAFYLDYLARLARRRVHGVRRGIIPELAANTEVEVAPTWQTFGVVEPTGVRAYVLRAPLEEGPGVGRLFARVTSIGSTGVPSGVLLLGRRKPALLTDGAWNGVRGLRPGRTALLLVTDASLADPSALSGVFQVEACTPVLRLHEVLADSPIAPAGVSALTLRYDLLGTPPGASFEVDLATRVSAKGFVDEQMQPLVWATGVDQTFVLLFQAPIFPPVEALFTIDLEPRVPSGAVGQAVSDHARVHVSVQDAP